MGKKTSSNVFDNYAEDYDNWFNKHEATFLSELILIQSLITKTTDCLEIGVGTGRFAQALGIKEGIEPSIEMGAIAKARGITVHQATAESLPFNDNSFNSLLMVTTICFIDNPNVALQEAHRVLRNNGHLIIGFVNKESTIGKRYLQTKDTNKYYQNAYFYSSEEIIKMLTQNSFEIKKIKQTLFDNENNSQSIQQPIEGYGIGSFVGIKASKTVVSQAGLHRNMLSP